MSKVSEDTKDTTDAKEVKVGDAEWLSNLYETKNTKLWQKTLLDLLDKNEMIEGYPSTDGLARLFRIVFGEFSTQVEVVKAPNSEDRSATVIMNIYANSNYFGEIRHSGAADVCIGNTKHPFSSHPVATAETKALGRALKRGLALKIHTHEEMLEGEVSYDKIDERQVRAIKNMSDKLKVNLEVFLAEQCGVSEESLESAGSTLSKNDGVKMLDELNAFRNKGVPENLTK